MIVPYIIFVLDISNFILFNAVFGRQVLELEGPFLFFGTVGSSTAFLSFIWKPIAGRLSDERGSALVLFWCLFGGLIGTILSYLSGSLYILFFARLIACIGSPSQVLIRTIISEIDKENHAENVSRLGILLAVVGVVTALASGFILELPDGLFYVYIIMICNSVLALGFAKLLPNTKTTKTISNVDGTKFFGEIVTALKNIKTFLTSDIYWDIFLIKAFISLSFGTVDSNCVIIFISVGIQNKYIGFLFTGICLAMVLANIIHLKINKKYYEGDVSYKRILHASIFLATTCAIAGYVSNLWIFIPTLLFMTTVRVHIDNSITELLLHKLDDCGDEKAVCLGCFDSVTSLTDLLAPIISSIALELSGKLWVYWISALFVMLSSGVALKVQSSVLQQKNKTS